MVEFVDIKTGKIFKGESPYIFWFDGGQSVNLNYIRKVCVISTYKFIRVKLESDVFSLLRMDQNVPQLYDPEKPGGKGEYINERLYLDVDYLKTNNFVSSGEYYNGFFIHMIYIMGQSQEAGEIHDNFYIIDKDGEFKYEVAADFYADNEILKTNLGNFNVNIPESIQKAIFDVNVHEESNDNIVLNRKYKELLMNYWDIIANKGSYNSLQNSLAWFEWGDLVRIEEFWKRHHEGMEEYFQTDLNHELDYEFITEFLNNSKTTYIGLYMALEKVQVNDGKLRYQGFPANPENPMDLDDPTNYIYEESNPWLDPVLTKWGLLDLCLKMTLLGNFYSTYFTPVHIETLHSTLEHWVFAYTTKVLHTSAAEYETVLNNIRPFDMVWDKRVKMRDHVCRNYSDTLFLSTGDVFGYESVIREEPSEVFTKDGHVFGFRRSGEILKYHMGGTYGVVHFKVMEDNPILAGDENDEIVRQVLHWMDDSGNCGDVVSYVTIPSTYMQRDGFRKTQYVFLPEFELGFINPGHYTLGFEFDTSYGNVWTRQIELDIEDDTRNHIDFYKVVRRIDTDKIEFNNETPVWLKSFQVGPGIDNNQTMEEVTNLDPPVGDGKTVMKYMPYKEHSIFLQQFLEQDIDVNHTVIYDIPLGKRVIINGQLVDTSSGDEQIVRQKLKDIFPGYIWIANGPYGNRMRIIGICRQFGKNPSGMITSIIGENCNVEYVASYRFHPFMHTLIPILTGQIASTDLIYMVPQLRHSRDIELRNWVFENITTGETIESYITTKDYYPDGKFNGDFGTKEKYGGMQGWFLAPQENVQLEPGYYNIKLQYKKGDEVQEYMIKSAFLMK